MLLVHDDKLLQLDKPLALFHPGLWEPPTQAASTYNRFNYESLIAAYDALLAAHPDYITKITYAEQSVIPVDPPETYSLHHYILAPEHYSKTFVVVAGQHGNEKDAPQTLYRIAEILCNETHLSGYRALAPLRNDVRFIIVPAVSPYGLQHGAMGIPYYSTRNDGIYTLNINRNYDCMHQWSLASGGVGGDVPFDVPENRHVRYIIEHYGPENINFFFDFHDGGAVNQHFWCNYNGEHRNGAVAIRQLVRDLCDYEEEHYPQYKDPENGWLIEHCADHAGYSSGVSANWVSNTMGVPAGACEYLGGKFGYEFTAEQMTRSLRTRANMIRYIYLAQTKGWEIPEAENARYFRFDAPCALTGDGARQDTTYHTVIRTHARARWDALVTTYPQIISKSAEVGKNTDDESVYSYTIGSGAKKVLLVGGTMRWGSTALSKGKHFEMLMWSLARWLCDSRIFSQSAILQAFKTDYTLVFLPFIDYDTAGANSSGKQLYGLNTTALTYDKWQIVNGVCERMSAAHKDTATIAAFLQTHSDADMIISGAEDTAGYSGEVPKYATTGFHTQIVEAMHQMDDTEGFAAYLSTLGETLDVEYTEGVSWMDYAYDHYAIPAYCLAWNIGPMWAVRSKYAYSETEDKYRYRNSETGRRVAAIINLIREVGA